MHVRMGDRREWQDGSAEYFELLELIMGTISAEVVGRGLQAPLFHVFSETLVPCPSGEEGLFDEFPTWPVGVDQVSTIPVVRCVQHGTVAVRCAPPARTRGCDEARELERRTLVKYSVACASRRFLRLPK